MGYTLLYVIALLEGALYGRREEYEVSKNTRDGFGAAYMPVRYAARGGVVNGIR